MACRPTPVRHTDPPGDAHVPQPRVRRGRSPGPTLVLIPARQHIRVPARPMAGAWIVVLAGSGTVGLHRRLLRPGTLVRLSPTDGPVTAAAEGLAYLSLDL